MIRRILCATATAALLLQAPTASAKCTYSLSEEGVKAEWTAFKFTSKAGVKGHFADTRLEGPREAATLTALAEGLSMQIDGKSVKTGNPGRDVTITTFFFGFMKNGGAISGKATRVEGNDKNGKVHIDVTMNGVTRDVPFDYTITPEGGVQANASVDMLDFGLQGAHEQIHKACEQQHTGEDGISKTWTQVDLALSGRFISNCE